MNGSAVLVPPVIRVATCKTCKFREPHEDGKHRCHEGPPQRAVFPLALPTGGFKLMEQVQFPEIGEADFCGRHKPRLAPV